MITLRKLLLTISFMTFAPLPSYAQEAWFEGPEGAMMRIVDTVQGETVICKLQFERKFFSKEKDAHVQAIHIVAHLADMHETEVGYIRAEWWNDWQDYVDAERRGGIVLNVLCGALPSGIVFRYYWPADDYERFAEVSLTPVEYPSYRWTP